MDSPSVNFERRVPDDRPQPGIDEGATMIPAGDAATGGAARPRWERLRPVDAGPQQAAASKQVRDSLARLETNSSNLQQSVESIDQWINRMEPRLEERRGTEAGIPGNENSGPAGGAAVDAAPAPAMVDPSTAGERRRRSQGVPVERRRAAHAVPERASPERPWGSRDVGAFVRRRWTAIAAVAVVTLMMMVLLIPGSRTRQPAVASTADAGPAIASAVSAGRTKSSAGEPMGTAAEAARTHPAKVEVAGAQGSAAATPRMGQSDPIISSTDDASAPAPAGDHASPAGVNVEADSRAGAMSPLVPSDAGPHSAFAKGAGPAPATIAPPGRAVSPVLRRVNVSSGVMAGNLVFSPQPAYPKGFASLFHQQGEVVMQAIISRRGRVENLRVISGHFLLRGAAKDAVRTWRYRPYLVNGTPVQVATIVSVEFHR